MKSSVRSRISIREMTLFSMLSMILFCSKLLMEMLPNIHLLGTLIMAYTVTFRKKALIPIYLYVFINGLYAGFSPWWVPYLYVWTVLWLITMLLPQNMPRKAKCIFYPVVCALHGLFYGVLYAPAQMIMFGLTVPQTIAWIASGFYFDILHGAGNLVLGTLILPLSDILKKLCSKM